jgi:CheY-like chemotaxis protein
MTTAARKLFLVHWNQVEAEEYARGFVDSGWEVTIEARDGRRAFESIRSDPPSVVVIYLTRMPSHGRETADAIRSSKSLSDIPIIFVGGQGEPLEKTRQKIPGAIFSSEGELAQLIESFSRV